MLVSGLPERNGNLHVKEIASVALNILKSVMTFKVPHKPDKELQIRIGKPSKQTSDSYPVFPHKKRLSKFVLVLVDYTKHMVSPNTAQS